MTEVNSNKTMRDLAKYVAQNHSLTKKEIQKFREFMTVVLDNGEQVVFDDYRDRLYYMLFISGHKPSYYTVLEASKFFLEEGLLYDFDVAVSLKSSYRDICDNENSRNSFQFTYKSMSKFYKHFEEMVLSGRVCKPETISLNKSNAVIADNYIARSYPEQYDPETGKVVSIRSIRYPFRHIYMYAPLFYSQFVSLGVTKIENINRTKYRDDIQHNLYIHTKDNYSLKEDCHTVYLKREYLHNYYGYIQGIREWIDSYYYPEVLLKNVMLSLDYEQCEERTVEGHANIFLNGVISYIDYASSEIRVDNKERHLEYVLASLGVGSTFRSHKVEEEKWWAWWSAQPNRTADWTTKDIKRWVYLKLTPADIVHIYERGDYVGWRRREKDEPLHYK